VFYIDTTKGTRISIRDVRARLYPSNLPANPTPDQLAPIGVEPIRETERPDAQPWQQVVEAEPADTDGDGVREQQWTVKERSLKDVQEQRIDQLRQKRNEGIINSASLDLGSDGVIVAPIMSAEEMARLNAMYTRAERASRNGETLTLSLTDARGNGRTLSKDQMIALGDAVLDAAQNWEEASQRHIEAVKAKTTAKSAWEYDDDLENDGWPTAV
jgi:hypothetical protein